jgi:PAS domain S-box-containing protein
MALTGTNLSQELEDRLKFETLISDLSARTVLAPPAEVDREIKRGLEIILRFFRCDRCGLLEVVRGKGFVHVTHGCYAEGLEEVPPELNLAALFPWAYHRMVVSAQPLSFASIHETPPEAEIDRAHWRLMGVKSSLNIPVFSGSDIQYIITIESMREERHWPETYLPRLRLLGEIFANAVERTRAADALRQSEERVSLAAEAAGAGLWALDPSEGVFWATPKARELFGWTADFEITVQAFLDRVLPGDLERVGGVLREALEQKKPVSIEYRIAGGDGQVRWIASRGRPSVNPDGNVARLMGVSVDVTDQRRAEEESRRLQQELAHVARVAMMGEVAASLAHELSQPLTAILSNAQAAQGLLSKGAPDLSEIGEIFADILSDGQRAAAVIGSLRTFLKKTEVELQMLDVADVVGEVVHLLRNDIALKSVSLEVELAPGPLVVRGDRIQLQQVLVNLVVNALDAVKGVEGRKPAIRVLTLRGSDTTVELSVADDGPGIARDQLDKIFEPFFTNKPGGMGMGLSITRSIVRAHGGRLRAENNERGGATFTVELPAERSGHG